MSQHAPSPRRSTANRPDLPRGRAGLVALHLAVRVATNVAQLPLPRGLAHLKDHLVRAADNTVLRLSEASGRTLGNRRQHLEAAYAENQEVQSDLLLLRSRGIPVPVAVAAEADRLGGLVYGLLRAESSNP